MSVSIDSEENRQAQSVSSAHRRHLDHLIDIQDGCPFTAVPQKLMRAYHDGYISESKFKLITMILSHSENFRIKRSYLVNRFSPKTLKKYLKEIEDEGYVRREKLPKESGGFEVIYHTNRVSFWQVPTKKVEAESQTVDSSLGNCSNVDDSSLGNRSLGNRSLGNPLKETKPEEKKEETKPMAGCNSRDEPQPAIRDMDFLDLVKAFENHFTGFKNYEENIEWFRQRIAEVELEGMKAFVLDVQKTVERHRFGWTLRNREILYKDWLNRRTKEKA